MVLDWVIHDISKRFNKEMLLRRGVGRKKKCGQRRVEYAQSRRLQTTQRIQLRIGSRFAWHFVQWFAQRGPTLFARRCNDFVLQWEKLQARRRAERLLSAAEFSSKKNGFRKLRKKSYLTLQSMIYIIIIYIYILYA